MLQDYNLTSNPIAKGAEKATTLVVGLGMAVWHMVKPLTSPSEAGRWFVGQHGLQEFYRAVDPSIYREQMFIWQALKEAAEKAPNTRLL